MAIATNFQTEMTPYGKTLTFVSNQPGYTTFEFSYSDPLNDGNYTIVGGSDMGCEAGASVLFRRLNFRFFGHQDSVAPAADFYIYRPASIQTGLSQTKTERAVPWLAWGLNYNWGFPSPYINDRYPLQDAYAHWSIMVGENSTVPFPHGHRYENVITNNAAYFAANPNLLKDILQNNVPKKNLNIDGVHGTADWDKLVNICAAYLQPDCAAHPLGCTHFDSLDGSDFGTDLTVEFTEAVAAAIRAGVPAISGYYSARAAVPNAKLGILAYNDHSAPPTSALTDAIYVQIASAFIDSGYTFEQTYDLWQAKCQYQCSVYYYPDIITYTYAQPMEYRLQKRKGFDSWPRNSYPPYFTEFAPSWITNCVPVNYMQMLTIDGDNAGTYADAITDVVSKLFNNDPKVVELYTLWGEPHIYNNEYTLKKSFDIINDMQTSAYKTVFKQYITFAAWWRRTTDLVGILTMPYNATAEDLLIKMNKYSLGQRLDQHMHAWAWMHYWGCNHIQAYPNVMFKLPDSQGGTLLYPSWYTDLDMPTDTDFDTEYALLQSAAARDTDLEDTELVVIPSLDIAATGTNNPKSQVAFSGGFRCMIVGPAHVIFTSRSPDYGNEEYIYTTYGPHEVILEGQYTASVLSGLLFVDGFYSPGRDKDLGTGRLYAWNQPSASGSTALRSSNIAYLYSSGGQFILYPTTSASYASPANLGTGIIAIDETTTNGEIQLGNINNWISLDPNVMLSTRSLVEAEFPGLMKATIVEG